MLLIRVLCTSYACPLFGLLHGFLFLILRRFGFYLCCFYVYNTSFIRSYVRSLHDFVHLFHDLGHSVHDFVGSLFGSSVR